MELKPGDWTAACGESESNSSSTTKTIFLTKIEVHEIQFMHVSGLREGSVECTDRIGSSVEHVCTSTK